jgi:hypothetical protein
MDRLGQLGCDGLVEKPICIGLRQACANASSLERLIAFQSSSRCAQRSGDPSASRAKATMVRVRRFNGELGPLLSPHQGAC